MKENWAWQGTHFNKFKSKILEEKSLPRKMTWETRKNDKQESVKYVYKLDTKTYINRNINANIIPWMELPILESIVVQESCII